MSKTLKFSKVSILSVSRTASGGTIKCSGALNKSVTDTMKWGETPDWQKGADLIGELTTEIIEFDPNDGEMAKQRFELKPAVLVYGFSLQRKQVKKGKSANKNP